MSFLLKLVQIPGTRRRVIEYRNPKQSAISNVLNETSHPCESGFEFWSIDIVWNFEAKVILVPTVPGIQRSLN